ncbi:MAG: hypothetical protein RL417_925 [Pseudomonadota bacterium]|jgi:hypothetical protein
MLGAWRHDVLYPGEVMNGAPLGIGGFFLGLIVVRVIARDVAVSRGALWALGLVWGILSLGTVVGGVPLVGVVGAVFGGAAIALFRPIGALAVLIGLLILRPWEMPGGASLGFVPRLFALLAVLSVGIDFVRRPERGLYITGAALWFLTLIAWFLVATLGAAGPTYLAGVELGNFVPITILFLLIPSVVHTGDDGVLIKDILVYGVVGAVCAALFTPHIPVRGEGEFSRLSGSGLFGNSNDLAALIVIALALRIVPRLNGGGLAPKLGEFGEVLVLLSGLWLTQSRGAVMGLVGGMLFTVMTGRLRRWAYLLVPVFLLALSLFFVGVRREEVDLETSQASRWSYIVAGVRMAKSHPVFGVGMENYPRMYERYTPAFDEWGERTAHSSWVLALAETGIPGLCLFMGFFIAIVRRAWRIRERRPEYIGVLVAYGIVMSFLSHTYTFLPYLLAAIVLGVERGEREEVSAEARAFATGGARVCFSR